MRQRRWVSAVLLCLLNLSAWAESGGNTRKFEATLANGATVELMAVTMNAPDRDTSKSRPWWRPDGTLLPAGLYDYAGIMTTDARARQFTLCIQADADYSCMTFNASGRTSTQPTIPLDAQNIRSERMSGIVYKLHQYCPNSFVDQLSTHDVEPLADESIGSAPCKVLKIVISSKDTVKWWVATEPDVFPLRIERYEHDCRRYRYEAKDLRMWGNGVVFPKSLSIAYYRQGDDGKPVLSSQKEIIIHSFSPWLYVTPKMLGKGLPDSILAQLPELEASARSLKGRPVTVTKIPELGELLKKGRPVLTCFVDIGQRPSRRCLQELKDIADRLQEKDLTVVAVQISPIAAEQLEQWILDQGIPFAILQAPSDFERKRLDWGIKSLPWMALTDADHFILREGLTSEEAKKLPDHW